MKGKRRPTSPSPRQRQGQAPLSVPRAWSLLRKEGRRVALSRQGGTPRRSRDSRLPSSPHLSPPSPPPSSPPPLAPARPLRAGHFLKQAWKTALAWDGKGHFLSSLMNPVRQILTFANDVVTRGFQASPGPLSPGSEGLILGGCELL